MERLCLTGDCARVKGHCVVSTALHNMTRAERANLSRASAHIPVLFGPSPMGVVLSRIPRTCAPRNCGYTCVWKLTKRVPQRNTEILCDKFSLLNDQSPVGTAKPSFRVSELKPISAGLTGFPVAIKTGTLRVSLFINMT